MAKRTSDNELKLRGILEALAPDIDVDEELDYATIAQDGSVRYRPPADSGPADDDDDDEPEEDEDDLEDEDEDEEDDDDEDEDEEDEPEPEPRRRSPQKRQSTPAKGSNRDRGHAQKRQPPKATKKGSGRGRSNVDSKLDPGSKDYDPKASIEAWVKGDEGD